MPGLPMPWTFLSTADAVAYCRLSRRTLQRAVARGDLVPYGSDGKWLFRRRDLDLWLATRGSRVRRLPPTQTVAAMAAVAVMLVTGVGCDVGTTWCHRHHFHAGHAVGWRP